MIQKIILYQAVRYEHKSQSMQPIKLGQGKGIISGNMKQQMHIIGEKCITAIDTAFTSHHTKIQKKVLIQLIIMNVSICSKSIFARLKNEFKKSVNLAQIITLICKHVPKSVHYIRIDTGSFFPNERFLLPVPNKQFSPQLYAKRLVQVCFPSFPCPEIGLTDYQLYEETTPVIGQRISNIFIYQFSVILNNECVARINKLIWRAFGHQNESASPCFWVKIEYEQRLPCASL